MENEDEKLKKSRELACKIIRLATDLVEDDFDIRNSHVFKNSNEYVNNSLNCIYYTFKDLKNLWKEQNEQICIRCSEIFNQTND